MPSRILRLWNPDASAWEEVGDSRLSTHLAAGDPHPVYLSATEGDAAYLKLTGGTLSGNLGVGAAATARLSVLAPSGNALEVKTGTAPGATRLAVDQNGTVALTPAAGQAGLTVAAGSVLTVDAGVASGSRVRSNGYLSLDSAANYVFPDRDNGVTLGSAGQRWVAVYAVAGSINTSLAEAKQAITPLAPDDALAAVRATDPVVFDYRPPERGPEWYELPDDPEQAAQVLEQRLRAAPLEEGARHQAGVVLDHDTYRTDPLFQTGDGQTNASNSFGVLLAALKAVDARLTTLEGA